MDVGLEKDPKDSDPFCKFRPHELPAMDHRVEECNDNVGSSSCKPALRCVVCGDSSSGKHYGVLACNGCSGFFKRSVRKGLEYRCQAANGDCIIDKAHRNQCQACRLKKCLKCGMNRDAVQNERQPRNLATVRPQFPPFGSISKSYTKATPPLLDSAMSDITVGVFSPFFTLPSKMYPSSSLGIPKHHHRAIKEETSIADFFPDRKSNISNETQVNPGSDMSTCRESCLDRDQASESIYETSSRILLMTIQWARNFPSYSSLCLDDQKVLLKETWSELFLLSALQWGLPLDSNPLFSTVLPRAPREARKHLCTLQKAATRLKILRADLAEFACLKAIVLFKPDAARLKDSYEVEILQDHSQLMLAHHVKTQHIDYIVRFGHLLLILPLLRQVPPETVEDYFFGNIIGSTSMEKFLCDSFKH